ncbi:MAG TPA: diguanylate cyclase, partial [Oceanospirillales bacterium]|nr:diguanylate cyclase [Oceanospirillales bacterium]
DFGTGYSSLGQFDRLPISTIKIDRAFVKDICSNRASLNLASVIISMTRTLNVSCVAEGVETEEQRQVLMRLGCNTGQGFLFSRPVPIEHFNELLRTASQEPPAEQPGRHERR